MKRLIIFALFILISCKDNVSDTNNKDALILALNEVNKNASIEITNFKEDDLKDAKVAILLSKSDFDIENYDGDILNFDAVLGWAGIFIGNLNIISFEGGDAKDLNTFLRDLATAAYPCDQSCLDQIKLDQITHGIIDNSNKKSSFHIFKDLVSKDGEIASLIKSPPEKENPDIYNLIYNTGTAAIPAVDGFFSISKDNTEYKDLYVVIGTEANAIIDLGKNEVTKFKLENFKVFPVDGNLKIN